MYGWHQLWPLTVGGLALVFLGYVLYWKRQGRLLMDPSGYLPPPASLARRLLFRLTGAVHSFFSIGPVTVVGGEKVNGGRRFIAVLNHQTERDVVLTPMLFVGKRPIRYFIANNRVRGPLRTFVAMSGGIPVFYEKGKGSNALHSATTALLKEPKSCFIIYPQGTLVRDNVLVRSAFYPGAVLIGQRVMAQGGAPMSYLPAAIAYIRDPKKASWCHWLLNRLGWKSFRKAFGEIVYGAVVVIGDPIPVESLPENVDASMDVLFERICELSQRAQEIAEAPAQ